jgi:hypothetical protein
MLHEKLVNDIQAVQQRMLLDGSLLPEDQLQRHYTTFRERFGVERLRSEHGTVVILRSIPLPPEDSCPKPVSVRGIGGSALLG